MQQPSKPFGNTDKLAIKSLNTILWRNLLKSVNWVAQVEMSVSVWPERSCACFWTTVVWEQPSGNLNTVRNPVDPRFKRKGHSFHRFATTMLRCLLCYNVSATEEEEEWLDMDWSRDYETLNRQGSSFGLRFSKTSMWGHSGTVPVDV